MTTILEDTGATEWSSPYVLPADVGLTSSPIDGRRRSRGLLDRLRTEGAIVWILCAIGYLIGAYFLDFVYLTFNGDAVARMANGFYVLYSRDPHLAAIGFVWNPGQSIADMVPLLFNHVWPAMASHDVAGSIVSAFAMAGSAYQVLAMLREWGVQRAPRLAMVTLYAIDPMIAYYGANGMSEGLYVFTLVATARYLIRWMRTDELRALVYSAVALGLCYVVRNEALGAAVLGAMLVVTVTWLRSEGSKRRRVFAALTDASIFELPFVISVTAWLVASYVITGSPLEQFTSIYGNATQEKFLTHKSLHGRLLYVVHAVWYLAPALVVIALIALILSWIKRDLGVLVPIAIVGGGLGFDVVSYVGNSIQPFLRYFITAVPLVVLLLGFLFSTKSATWWLRRASPEKERPASPGVARRPGWLIALAGVIGAVALLGPGLVTTAEALQKPSIGYEESEFLGLVLNHHLSAADKGVKSEYPAEVSISTYIDNLHLADGSVIVDNSANCIPGVVTMVNNPKVFVIPNDRSFQRTLADPLTFHARFILEADPVGTSSVTSINVLYPDLWSTGAGFARRVHTFDAGGCRNFRLFRVFTHPTEAQTNAGTQA